MADQSTVDDALFALALDLLRGKDRPDHWGRLSDQEAKELRRTLRAVERWHRAGHVIGFGRGPKLVDGLPTADHACRIYVRRKRTARQIRPSERIPERLDLGPGIGEILLDVIQSRRPRLSALTDPHDVAFPGLSVGHCRSGITGTIGAVLQSSLEPGARFLLGACHVFANSGLARRGDAIIQPGRTDGGSCPSFTIAKLYDYEPLVPSGDNQADLAIARLDDGLQWEPGNRPIRGIARPADLFEHSSSLYRLGCHSGESVVLLTDKNFVTSFRHPVKTGGDHLFQFSGLLRYTGFSLDGDSGGPLMTESGDLAGIHIGIADGTGVGVPAWAIPSRWNLQP